MLMSHTSSSVTQAYPLIRYSHLPQDGTQGEELYLLGVSDTCSRNTFPFSLWLSKPPFLPRQPKSACLLSLSSPLLPCSTRLGYSCLLITVAAQGFPGGWLCLMLFSVALPQVQPTAGPA